MSLIFGRRNLAGAGIGGIDETQEMLEFCAEHALGSDIELINAEQINDAYERVLASDVRYRFVIDAASFASRTSPGPPPRVPPDVHPHARRPQGHSDQGARRRRRPTSRGDRGRSSPRAPRPPAAGPVQP
jgi:hypothetical protein